MKKDTILHTMTKKLVCNWRTRVLSAAHSSSLTGALRIILMLVVMVMGAGEMWGQSATLPNGDGYYYIINKGKPTDKVWYLKPATIEYEEGKPYLTTNTTGQVPGSLWIIKSNGNFHQIIHAEDMKYVTIHNAKSFGTGYTNNRARMHLETITIPGDNNDFVFSQNDSQYNIKHKTLVANANNVDNIWWNPANDNNTRDDGGDKSWQYLIGLYNLTTGGSVWELTFVKKCVTPEFSYDSENNKISISSVTSGTQIYYTTNGDEPDRNSQLYEGPFSAEDVSVVKAIAYKDTFEPSDIGTRIVKPVKPVIDQTNCDNSLSITCRTEGAVIYYTTDDTPPTTNSTPYNGPFTPASGETVKAIAYIDNAFIPSSDEETLNYTPLFTATKPTITVTATDNGSKVEITGSGTIYYTTNGNDPEVNETQRYTAPFTISNGSGIVTIKAIVKEESLSPSCVIRRKVYEFIEISDLDGLQSIADNPDRAYRLTNNIEDAKSFGKDITFSGVFDGGYHTIKGLKRPLFSKLVDEGTVKNVILDNITISNSSHAGAITNEAEGSARIYNCGVLSKTGNSSITSTSGYAGGIVGKISGDTRVVNCYNYASVTGGTYAGGIVGKNVGVWNNSILVSSPRVALCMMYGDLSGGSEANGSSPVYAGDHVSNKQNFTEYNFWRSKANVTYKKYNDQLAIDKDDYLTRFPFYRHILNTHRELAAFFLFGESGGTVTDIQDDEIAEIGHWVLNKDVAPYPIVERWMVDTKKVLDAPAGTTVSVRKGDGSPITSLAVTVKIGNNTYTTYPGTNTALTLPITDMDEANHDYTWGKVVLPFANEFEENTDYSKICTGWKITGITGGTEGSSFSKYDVSNRDCTSKDKYTTTGFIFAQGGNYIVPYNVTAIEITANFATAYYLSDASYDIGYSGDKSGSGYGGRTPLGGSTPTKYHGKDVYNTLAAALGDMASSGTTHDQAVVLVGNYHQDDEDISSYTAKGLTIMSIDADNNQEPDYAWYSNNTQDRPAIPPTRFDFVALIPVGMSSRVNNNSFYPGIPIWKPRGWFEMTETSLSKMDQFELSSNNFNTSDGDTRNYRCIINGGYFTQMVRSRNKNNGACTKVKYYQIGGNAYIKEFYPGNHSADGLATTLCPINVTGGEIEQCFMTGFGKGTAIGPDIFFWCAGGKIDKFLGAYMEKPKQASNNDGNVNMTAKIDHAKIGRFFGGGTSPKAPITGNIDVTINNSHVDFYCGGPEFGNMSEGKTVKTSATNTVFEQFYGAGFGGTAITYTNDEDNNDQGIGSTTKSTVPYPSSFFTTYYSSNSAQDKGRLKYNSGYGIGSCYKMEFIFNSRGAGSVARFYTGYAQFDLATTGSVTNELTGCTINGDFYGAGCQGKVNGTVTSTLTNCTLKRSAFGGGYKAESNEVEIYTTTPPSMSTYTRETGIFSVFGEGTHETYNWAQGDATTQNTVDGTTLYTSKDITIADLGNVTGAISLTINGGSVGAENDNNPNHGNVYGGGNESKSLNNTTVTLKGSAHIYGNVFGGGNQGLVTGSATVNITQ